MTKKNLYLNTTFAALFSVMLVSSVLHGNYNQGLFFFSIAFGVILTFSVYRVSKSSLVQAEFGEKTDKKEASAIIKVGKILMASYALAFGISVLIALILLLPIGFEPIRYIH